MKSRNLDENADSLYSYGTFPIIDKLELLAKSPHFNYDTILMNVSTLIRNRASKELRPNDIVSALEKEISFMISDLADIYEPVRHLKPYLFLYIPDYNKVVPNEFQRPQTDSRKQITEITSILRDKVKFNDVETTVKSLTVILTSLRGRIASSDELASKFIKIRNKHKTLMVSSFPMDYHLVDHIRDVSLLESHTGNITPHLNTKVFDTDTMPFTKATHVLLGDKVQILSCLSRAEKKALLELADTDNWKVKTTKYVDEYVKTKFKLPYHL